MELSFEAKWLHLRRQFEEDAAALACLAETTTAEPRASLLHGKAAYAVTALRLMDEADRAGGPRA
jgi:hypothetical protein